MNAVRQSHTAQPGDSTQGAVCTFCILPRSQSRQRNGRERNGSEPRKCNRLPPKKVCCVAGLAAVSTLANININITLRFQLQATCNSNLKQCKHN